MCKEYEETIDHLIKKSHFGKRQIYHEGYYGIKGYEQISSGQ